MKNHSIYCFIAKKLKYRVFLFSFFCFIAVLSSCGYHLGYDQLTRQYSTISIPYIEGDLKGELTAAIIKNISLTGALKYTTSNGNLILKVKLLEIDEENVGFRYDRKQSGRLKKVTIPSETRFSLIAEVSLIDQKTQQTLKGPARVKASIDFDHNFYTVRHYENIFSLGQLTDIDSARTDAMEPLNRELATKITDYILNSW